MPASRHARLILWTLTILLQVAWQATIAVCAETADSPAEPSLEPSTSSSDRFPLESKLFDRVRLFSSEAAKLAAEHGPQAVSRDWIPRALVDDTWTTQFLPDSLIYPAYLAGMKESRFASMWVHEREAGWIWDITLGGHVGILRYGTEGNSGLPRPNGWQLDIEGAAFPRLDLEHQSDLIASDFRFGIPLSFGYNRYQTKLAFYHLSSHLGDEYMLRFPNVDRINYSRNSFVWGNAYYLTDALRLYAETAWACYTNGGAKPWEFQFGVDYSPTELTRSFRGVPFFAVNTHLREEVDFGGNLVVQTGWQWRGLAAHLLRFGIQYFNGKSEQFEFFREHEEKLGLAVWYDY